MSETDVLVLRPAAGPRRQVLTIAAVIAVTLVVAGVLAGGRPALITCIGLVLLLAATIAVYLRRSRIVVTPVDISARGLTFHRRRDRALAASLIRATVVQPGAVSETIVVLDGGGHALLSINGALYAPADLDRLVNHLGLPTGRPDGLVTMAQLARERPGTVGWIGRNLIAFTLLCALGFAVAAVVLGTVVAALTD
ncbi:hypothetical protein EV649_4716 [Kribbella sp. VKM Ac-2569]|uniref:hypothetical protein n=1 Tax=Kribbella sp. VKM Ac-2569 TaxID=2512220 RepID=UPI00102BFA08|nr:hypothetical protein [Kribbella sp. VKM Ac-2569]RZT17179.1 hypothetical protein EV649_4716 [Kribbella sp. VKM Ac-2569]